MPQSACQKSQLRKLSRRKPLCRKGCGASVPAAGTGKNTAKPEKDLTVFLLTTPDGRTALRRRPETGLLSGLWEFPNTAGELTETLAAQQLLDWGLTPLSWEKRFSDRHIFTHLRWNMTVFRLTVAGDGPPDWVWASDDRDLYPMPTAFKKLENK